MQAMKLSNPGGLDKLALSPLEPVAPGPGQIQVAVKASSLNFHDYAVVSGLLPTADGRIPMSDGAGVVTAVGEGVTEFTEGDKVLSCFFPNWLEGAPALDKLVGVPGDHVDGFAANSVTMAAQGFTRMPANLDFESAATLTWGTDGAGGTGNWNTTTTNWWDGSSNVPWTSVDDALFTGTPGTVTLRAPWSGIRCKPRWRSASRSAAAPARPLPLRP